MSMSKFSVEKLDWFAQQNTFQMKNNEPSHPTKVSEPTNALIEKTAKSFDLLHLHINLEK